MGSQRRQHHAQQEAMREANRQAEIMREQQRLFQEQLRQQREAMLRETANQRLATSPETLQSTVGAQNAGVRTSRSNRQTSRAMGSGAASLRIPLNIGGSSGSGLNIG